MKTTVICQHCNSNAEGYGEECNGTFYADEVDCYNCEGQGVCDDCGEYKIKCNCEEGDW